ncbi:MAG: acyl-CoA dehydrogenase [Pseudomonadota bacterium]
MPPFEAPIRDIGFAIFDVIGTERLAALPAFQEMLAPDLGKAVLEEAGKFAAGVLAPLNRTGDREGSVFENGVVRTPKGFKKAYAAFVAGGWNAVPFEPAIGGQGFPWLLATPIAELWASANLAFSLCPMLTQGAIEAIGRHGSAEQKRAYLPKLVSGEWTGTMNLTEPQAGSDLARTKARAVRKGAHYRLTGQKIFITYGEHDLAENIVHMVLARTPDAPEGTKGISLFIVPKFLLKADGSLGERNDLRCVSLEHKLGIHASPTAVLSYGDEGGAVGYLVGKENEGLVYMFTMMNQARLAVGLEGVALAERATQQAIAYAKERVQGRAAGGGGDVPIVRHADVRRMLMTMKAYTEATRYLAYLAAEAQDLARHHVDADVRKASQARVDLLTPVVKAWCSDVGFEVASLGVQVHGGVGYIEETGAAQHLRDARIAMIYEGTNGIQAMDLVQRKLRHDRGKAARAFLADMASLLPALRRPDDAFGPLHRGLDAGLKALGEATDFLLEAGRDDPHAADAGAAPYLRLFGTVAGGYLMARAALAAARRQAEDGADKVYFETHLALARFYAERILPEALALAAAVRSGGASVMAIPEDRL